MTPDSYLRLGTNYVRDGQTDGFAIAIDDTLQSNVRLKPKNVLLIY